MLLGFTERESFSSFFATLRIGTKGSFVGQLNWTVPKVNTCPALPWRAWRMFEYMQCIQSQPKMSHFLPFHIFSLGEFLSIQSRCNNVTPEEHQSLLTPAAWPLLWSFTLSQKIQFEFDDSWTKHLRYITPATKRTIRINFSTSNTSENVELCLKALSAKHSVYDYDYY